MSCGSINTKKRTWEFTLLSTYVIGWINLLFAYFLLLFISKTILNNKSSYVILESNYLWYRIGKWMWRHEQNNYLFGVWCLFKEWNCKTFIFNTFWTILILVFYRFMAIIFCRIAYWKRSKNKTEPDFLNKN